MYVVLLGCVKSGKGLLNDELKNRRREINFEGALVDSDDAGAFFKDYAGDGGLTTANCIDITIISGC
jgi:hypothetical protein